MTGRREPIGRGPLAATLEPAAPGVWLLRGGFPKRIANVYLLEDDGGVTVYDSGFRRMAPAILAAAERLGGIKRVVLGHAHEDHRGAAPLLGAPVYCHELERADAERQRIDYYDFAGVPNPLIRTGFVLALEWFNGGPCQIAGTLGEGDQVAGFQVVHLPGHAPGQIALWRDEDRVALTSDCFYTLNMMKVTMPYCDPICTVRPLDHHHEHALLSLRKLAQMEPAQAWPGHAKPVLADVSAQLCAAADGWRA
jgi:glyoxylase-like metal-dependent hydrolase (beta-lactamase superfamily II)